MAEVYKHVLKEHAQDIIICGLKLSQYGLITIRNGESMTRFIPAFFNPKDEVPYYGKDEYACLRITIPNNYCKVGNDFLRNDNNSVLNDLFVKSIIPVEEYQFGTYRNPVCLISRTVQDGEIALTGKHLDYPVIVDDSEELYLHNIINNKTEKNSDWLDAVLYSYYCDLADKGHIVKIESYDSGISVFINKDRQIITLKMPATEEIEF
ncbi:MAG TPA: hypothetical protein DDZ89_05080 [Clostridiales bacterium]|nr:hypothetical protein [Clostridiales bacterium]